MSDNLRLNQIIEQNHLRTSDLLLAVKEGEKFDNLTTAQDLFRFAPAARVGLARDGYWYTAEQNAEVAEAIAQNKLTFAAEQYQRNRI